MKKLIIAILIVAFATPAVFAADINGTDIGGSEFTPSTLVKLFALANDSAYGAASGHKNGDKYYTTTSTSASIDDGSKGKGTDISADKIPSDWNSTSS